MFIKWFSFFLTILTTEGLSNVWKFDNFSPYERVLNEIFKSCYVNDSTNLIVVFGNLNGIIDHFPIIWMNSSLNVDGDNEKSRSFNDSWNIETIKVILNEDSPEKLQSDILLFKKTRWWNHMSPFFIIVRSDEQCENFKDILNTIWKENIINSVYVCSESRNTSFYTLNPITNYAPYPWKRIEEFNDSNVYHQIFDPKISCKNLNYDKTKILNGYKIRAIARHKKSAEFPTAKDKLEAFPELSENRMYHSILNALNASLEFDEHEVPHEAIINIDNGTSDLVYGPRDVSAYRKNSFLFPHHRGMIVAIIRTNPEVSTLQKILHLWSLPVLMGATVALAILFSIFAIKNRDLSSAMLDMIRFLTCVSIQTNTASNSFRIYFTTMLIFIVTSNGVFQGKIAAFLTTRETVKPAETINELADLGYKFYAYELGYQLMHNRYKKEVTKVLPEICIEHVLNAPLTACLLPIDFYEAKLSLKPLDYVKEPLSFFLVNIKSRRNWPLQRRFNNMIVRLVESGLYNFWYKNSTYEPKQKRKTNDMELASAEYRPVKLVKLDFAFKLLATGLLVASIAFIVELILANDGRS